MKIVQKFILDVREIILNGLFGAEDSTLQEFKLGFVAGILLFFILAVIIRLSVLLFFSRDKRSKGIRIMGDEGTIVISPSAVSDLIKGIGNSIKHIEVSNVKLLEEKESGAFITVHLIMEGIETNFSKISSDFQKKIQESLKEQLGIECIKKIVICLDKIIIKTGKN
jgi:hypothetical protein